MSSLGIDGNGRVVDTGLAMDAAAVNDERCPVWSTIVPVSAGCYHLKLTHWFIDGAWTEEWTGERLQLVRLEPNQNGVLFIAIAGHEPEPFDFWQKNWRGEWLRIPDPDDIATREAAIAEARRPWREALESIATGYPCIAMLIGRPIGEDDEPCTCARCHAEAKLRDLLAKAGV